MSACRSVRASRPVRTDPHVFCVYKSGCFVLVPCRWDRQVVLKLRCVTTQQSDVLMRVAT